MRVFLKSISSRLMTTWLLVLFSIFGFNTAHANPVLNPSINANAKPLESVSLRLKWKHQFQFAGYYAALEKGFYREEGLDVTIHERDLQRNNIQEVLDGEFNYGISDTVLLLYQAKNNHLKIIAPIFQHSPQVLMTLKSSGIETPYQLKNVDTAFYLKDADGFAVLAMLKNLKVEPNIQRIVKKTDPQMLVRQETQAYACYLTNEPYTLQQQGIAYNIINPMNYGVDFYGDMLFTNQQEAEEHPQRVEAFKRATIKGWQYALNHKFEIAQLISQHYSTEKTLDHLLYEANAIEEIIKPNTTPIGTLDKGRMAYISGMFQRYGLSNKPFDINQGIFEPQSDSLRLTDIEQKWLINHPNIRAAFQSNLPPIDFINHKEHQGIAIGYARKIGQLTGLKMDWSPFKTGIFNPEENEVQPQLMITNANLSEVAQHYRFSRAYFSSPFVIATQNNEPYISDLQQLKSKTISVIKGSLGDQYLQNQALGLNIIQVKSTLEGLKAVANGRVKAHIDSAAAIGYTIKTEGFNELQIAGSTPFKVEYRFAIHKDEPILLSIINKILLNMDEDTHQKIQTPWLKVDYHQRVSWESVIKLAIPLLIILILALLYSRKLKTLNKKLQTTVKELNDSQAALQNSNQKLSILSTTDRLTKAYNRTYIDQRLAESVDDFHPHQKPLSLLMLDLDFFKSVNDIFGHLAGDKVLIKMADFYRSQCREQDLFARWGGEEFMILSLNTDLNSAKTLAQRICNGTSNVLLPHGLNQTVSIGVTQYQSGESIESFVNRADQALYIAKTQGRNQVISL